MKINGNLLVHFHWIFVKKSSFFITKNIGILLLWLASSGSLDCFYALIKIYNFIKIMFFQVAFLDFQNLQEWGRRINDTYTKMNGISEVRPSIFGGRRQIIRPCTLAGHVAHKGFQIIIFIFQNILPQNLLLCWMSRCLLLFLQIKDAFFASLIKKISKIFKSPNFFKIF